MNQAKKLLGRTLSSMFFIVSVALTLLAGVEFVQAFDAGADKELINGIVRAINTAFIALATFELGVGIDKEYSVPEHGDRIYTAVRRMVARFVSVTCIALVLEAHGYQVTVTELTGWEHSLKNELILARRVHRENREARARLDALVAATGVRPKILRVLGGGG